MIDYFFNKIKFELDLKKKVKNKLIGTNFTIIKEFDLFVEETQDRQLPVPYEMNIRLNFSYQCYYNNNNKKLHKVKNLALLIGETQNYKNVF